MNHRMKLVDVVKVGYQTYYLFRCQYCSKAYYIVRWKIWLKLNSDQKLKLTRLDKCPGIQAERRHLRYDPTG